LFQGDITHQLKLWLSMGIIGIPLASVFSGLLLTLLAKPFLKVTLSIPRTIWVQFVATLFSWMFYLILVLISLLLHNQALFQVANWVAAVFIAAVVYAKMLKDQESRPLGMRRGLILSGVLMLIAILVTILLRIPIEMLRT